MVKLFSFTIAALLALYQQFRKKWVLTLICILIIGISYAAMFRHYASFRFESKSNDLVYMVEAKLLDLRLKIRGPLKGTGKVGILAVDEASIAEFGRWPFSRRYYAQALQNLKSLGVKWVGFDAIFSEPERASAEDFVPIIQSLKAQKSNRNLSIQLSKFDNLLAISPPDQSFQKAIAAFGSLVLGYVYFVQESELPTQHKDPKLRFPQLERMAQSSEILADLPKGRTLDSYPELMQTAGLIANTEEISSAASHFAFFNNSVDNDAIFRWVTLFAHEQGHLMPSLSLKLAAEYLQRDIFVVFDEYGVETVALVSRENPEDVLDIPIDARGAGRMLINHLGPRQTFRHYSLADVYHNRLTEKEKKQLKDSVLILGGTATGTNDIRPNPFDSALDGVENHAAALDNILSQNFLRRPVSIYKTELLIILIVGLLFAPIMIFGHALVSGAAALVFLIGYYFLDRHFWFGQGTWTYIAVPCLEIIGMFVLTTVYKYLTEELERKRLKGAFQHYLSPQVINQMLEHPEAMQLGGVRRELTVLFSDMRGFTTLSESLTPEQLCVLMNDYFTPMTTIILRSGGVLDKYIGDAIMAFWGAPLPMPNNADIAAQVAIEMLYALERLNQEFIRKQFPTVDIGIGLNTGPMSVGNMGSLERFTYTVMGDAVNLGSRLEGLTKDYGIKIMISESTAKLLSPGKFLTRDIDDIRVKGKHEPVHVFEIMMPNALPNLADVRALIAHFAEGRKAYKAQHWQEAMEHFHHCLELRPSDVASLLYIERCRESLVNPPAANWDGVYTFTHK